MNLSEVQQAIEAHTAATNETIEGLRATITKQDTTINGLKNTMLELEQKAAELGSGWTPGDIGGGSDVADMLVKHDLWKAVAGKQTPRTQIEVKAAALLAMETKNTITGNDRFGPSSHTGMFPGMQRRRFLFDFLNAAGRIVPVSTGAIEYGKETSYDNQASLQGGGSPFVQEGVAKAESALVYSLESLTIPTTAHFLKASNQVLSDVNQLRALIDARLRYGLMIKNENEIINGTGTGASVGGFTKSGNHTVYTPSSGDTPIDSINRAISALETAEGAASIVLLNPATWRSLQRVKATGGSEEYLFGSPSGQNRESVWNTPVLPTNAVTAGKQLVIDLMQFGEYYLREDARVDVGFVNDDFTKNLVTIRAEMRGAVAVVRSEAVIYGDLTL